MSAITVILFLIYTWGFGFSLTSYLKNSDNFLERNLMRLGIGLVFTALLFIILAWLKIPLNWWLILLLSLIIPLIYLFKNYSKLNFKFKPKKSDIYILIVLLLFAFTFFMYYKGAFAYPWMEDDDSWTHAYGAKYVSVEKTIFEPYPGKNLLQYMDAYPPIYDAAFGILHQVSPSLMWTMKFFNVLIISLSIIFFYFFAKEFMQSREKALFATFVLAMIPCYVSHFIWSHALIPAFFFVTVYSLEKIKHDKKWLYPSLLMVAGLLLVHPTQAVKVLLMLLAYCFIKWILEKEHKKAFFAVSGGFLLSLLVWWVPMLFKYGSDFITLGLSQKKQTGLAAASGEFHYIGRIGSSVKVYTFNDFFFAQKTNMINNPIGVGIVLCILLFLILLFFLFYFIKTTINQKEKLGELYLFLLCLELLSALFLACSLIPNFSFWSFVLFGFLLIIIYFILIKKVLPCEKHAWKLITLIWLLFTYLGIHGGTRFPIALFSFRVWMLFAIPFALIVSETVDLINLFKKYPIAKYALLTIILIGVWYTSGIQKYTVNTAVWSPGGWLGPIEGETEGFLWLKELPVDTKVFTFSFMNKFPIGFDKFSCEWCPEVIEFRQKGINSSAPEVYSWLKDNGYEYVVMDYYFAREYGANFTNKRMDEILSTGKFQPVYQTSSVVVLQIT